MYFKILGEPISFSSREQLAHEAAVPGACVVVQPFEAASLFFGAYVCRHFMLVRKSATNPIVNAARSLRVRQGEGETALAAAGETALQIRYRSHAKRKP